MRYIVKKAKRVYSAPMLTHPVFLSNVWFSDETVLILMYLSIDKRTVFLVLNFAILWRNILIVSVFAMSATAYWVFTVFFEDAKENPASANQMWCKEKNYRLISVRTEKFIPCNKLAKVHLNHFNRRVFASFALCEFWETLNSFRNRLRINLEYAKGSHFLWENPPVTFTVLREKGVKWVSEVLHSPLEACLRMHTNFTSSTWNPTESNERGTWLACIFVRIWTFWNTAGDVPYCTTCKCYCDF